MVLKLIVLSFLGLALLIGCSRGDRPAEFLQGQGGKDLYSVSEYQGKKCLLHTEKVKSQSKARVSSSQNQSLQESIGFLEFTTDCPFFPSEFPFKGLPHRSYEIIIEFTLDQHLVFSKLAKKEELSHEELISSTDVEGQKRVRLFQFPVTLYTVEKLKDEYGNEGKTKGEFKAASLYEATHFKINPFDREDLILEKLNTFEKSYFTSSQWFYGVTILKRNHHSDLALGKMINEGFQDARVAFVFTPDQMEVRSVNLDHLLKDHEENPELILTLKAEHLDYQTDWKNGGKLEKIKEEKKGDNHRDSRIWNQREYVELDFKEITGLIRGHDKVEFLNFDQTQDYFSFTIRYKTLDSHQSESIDVKYSFLRASKELEKQKKDQQKIYWKQDQKRFGYFKSIAHKIHRHDIKDDLEFQKNIKASKFMPLKNSSGNRVITYYLSSETHSSYYDMIESAIKDWDAILSKLGINLVLAPENERKQLGDIRYNIINVIDVVKNHSSDRIAGYGPAILDPITGEVVSATSNIYVDQIRTKVYRHLENFLLSRVLETVGYLELQGRDTLKYQELLKTLKEGPKDQLMNTSPVMASGTRMEKDRINHMFDQSSLQDKEDLFKMFPYKLLEPKDENLDEIPKIQIIKMPKSRSCQANDVIGAIDDLVKFSCKNFENFVNNVQGISHIDEIGRQIQECTEIILPKVIAPSLLHELGHNLGLSHNFAASTQIQKDKMGKIVAYASSVMDYLNENLPPVSKPGPYDIKALQYLYATNESLQEKSHLSDQEFAFCSDEDLDRDPYCHQFDTGETIEEIAKSFIDDFLKVKMTRSKRYYHSQGVGLDYYLRQIDNLFKLKKIYNHWRAYLLQNLKYPDPYLLSYQKDNADEQIITNIAASKKEEVQDFIKAKNVILDFFMELIASNSRVCIFDNHVDHNSEVVQSSDRPSLYGPVSFEEMRQYVKAQSGEDLHSCHSLKLSEYFQFTHVSEEGEPVHPILNSEDFQSFGTKRVEEAGFGIFRALAMDLAVLRNCSEHNCTEYVNEDFIPGFFDEYHFRNNLISYFRSRLAIGVKKDNTPFPLFAADKEILLKSYRMFLKGLTSLQSSSLVGDSMSLFRSKIYPAQSMESLNDHTIVTQDNRIYIRIKDEVYSANLMVNSHAASFLYRFHILEMLDLGQFQSEFLQKDQKDFSMLNLFEKRLIGFLQKAGLLQIKTDQAGRMNLEPIISGIDWENSLSVHDFIYGYVWKFHQIYQDMSVLSTDYSKLLDVIAGYKFNKYFDYVLSEQRSLNELVLPIALNKEKILILLQRSTQEEGADFIATLDQLLSLIKDQEVKEKINELLGNQSKSELIAYLGELYSQYLTDFQSWKSRSLREYIESSDLHKDALYAHFLSAFDKDTVTNNIPFVTFEQVENILTLKTLKQNLLKAREDLSLVFGITDSLKPLNTDPNISGRYYNGKIIRGLPQWDKREQQAQRDLLWEIINNTTQLVR